MGTYTELEMLRKGLDFIFFRRRQVNVYSIHYHHVLLHLIIIFLVIFQIPLDRSAAFIKRLSTSCLNWPSETALLCLNTIQRLIQVIMRTLFFLLLPHMWWLNSST